MESLLLDLRGRMGVHTFATLQEASAKYNSNQSMGISRRMGVGWGVCPLSEPGGYSYL